MTRTRAGAAVAALLLVAATSHAAATFLAVGTVSGPDLLVHTGSLEDGSPENAMGGISAIAYAGSGNTYLLLPDRGPNAELYPGGELVDNTKSYINRFESVDIAVTYDSRKRSWHVLPVLTATTPLRNATPLTGSSLNNSGKRYFTGLSSSIDVSVPTNSMRLDSEGLRVSNDGAHVFVSDEYGPFIYEFDRSTGQRVRSIRVPRGFGAIHQAPIGANETANNGSGREPNRGLEGLAISPDGTILVALMQSPLLQDHAISKDDGVTHTGINTRMLAIDLQHCTGGDVANCPSRQYLYQESAPDRGNSEIVAVNAQQFLVIERDSLAGPMSVKNIYLIDTSSATDISYVAELPATGLPAGVTPVGKRLFLNLTDMLYKAGQTIVEKFEGLAFGPDLADGRRLLLVTVDNEFDKSIPNSIYAFAVDQADLSDYTAQQFRTGQGVQ
jgi:hypothetical protein